MMLCQLQADIEPSSQS